MFVNWYELWLHVSAEINHYQVKSKYFLIITCKFLQSETKLGVSKIVLTLLTEDLY